MKYNEIDMKNWKECDINTDSLWIIKERDKSGKHKNIYHGNFIPQIPNQLIKRYTKKDEIILEPFMGSGTTLFECEKLNRKYIGFDINPQMLNYVNESMSNENYRDNFYIDNCNSLDTLQIDKNIKKASKAIPLVMSNHLIGDCTSIPILVVCFLYSSTGISITFIDYAVFAFLFTCSRFAIATFPGGGIISILVFLNSHFGIPPEMTSILATVVLLIDSVNTFINISSQSIFVSILSRALNFFKFK